MVTTVTLWLLIVMSDSGTNRGAHAVIDRFVTVDSCEHVRKNLPGSAYSYHARCVQANVAIVK